MTSVDYERAEHLLGERVGEHALAHSRAVAETAALLATVYGVDPASARLAGLLHDWDRELGPDQLLSSAEALGIDVTDADREVPYLLHAQTGAQGVRAALPDVPDEVIAAIARHTVGAPDMSDLDMVVYIADMISPDRTYGGVAELREAVGNVGLGELFALCYRHSIGHLVREGKRIHPHTVEVWNSQVARGRHE